MKYFGNFTDRESVAREFSRNKYNDAFTIPVDFPTDEELLLASYETPGYDGMAFVLFQRDGQLFEVHGSHCSCYGLENQWNPEATTWEALAMRPRPTTISGYGYIHDYYGMSDDMVTTLWALIDAHVGPPR